MQKIRTNSVLSNILLIYFLPLFIGTIVFLQTNGIYSYLCILIIVIVVLSPAFFLKDKYIKEIIIEDEYIELIYKKNFYSFDCEHIKIPKSDIRKFNVSIEKTEINLYKSKYIYHTRIKICRTSIPAIKIDINRRVGDPYYTFLECLKYSQNIPNFSFKTQGLHSFEKEEIDYILKTGKRKINFIFLGIIIFFVTLLGIEIAILVLSNL